MLTIEKVNKAAEILKPVIRKTDLIYSSFLSKLAILLKCRPLLK